ncbi:MAG: hypothetical protein EOM08_13105 [Clostridia bacterium]|jgi:hypothetical protein|nr:hypothetical protein [Clostridia bacterium]
MLARIASTKLFRFFLETHSIVSLVAKSALLLAVPYVYLMLSGLVFDFWLKWYFMTTFIFISLVLLTLLVVTLIIWSIVRFARQKQVSG